MNKKNAKHQILFLTIIFALAWALSLYPFVSNAYNYHVQQTMIVLYEGTVESANEDIYEEAIEAAQAWNEELYTYISPSYFPEELEDGEIYESLLNLSENGMMGYISIPKIDVSLPIYHYATEEVLLKGAGHLSSSALPVGGESTHCVITAHRGLPNAMMFTDLDQLEIGDEFYLKVLGETLAYKVIRIETVDPDETQSLQMEDGKDLCTLVTCTPYGINTQRLLVTGERTEYIEGSDGTDNNTIFKALKAYWYAVILFFIELILYILLIRMIKKNTRGNNPDKRGRIQKTLKKINPDIIKSN